MNFKFYNLHITQESKLAWEKGEIRNPRLSLKGVDEQELSIDELEELMIETIRNSFSDLRSVISINEFNEAKIIMPALQMCSVDKIDVVDFGIAVINPPIDGEPDVEYLEEQSLSDWNHPSEMWEEFAKIMTDDENGDDGDDEYNSDMDDGFSESESEIDIIKKSINGGSQKS